MPEPSLVRQIATSVRFALAQLDGAIELIVFATDQLGGYARSMASITAGSAAPESVAVIQLISTALARLEASGQALKSARTAAQRFLDGLQVVGRASSADAQPFLPPPTTSRTRGEHIARCRRRLPVPWPRGRQLQGWVLNDHGQDDRIASGTKLADGTEDPAYTRAVRRSEQLGLARGGFVPDIARHIEIKQASSMSPGETRVIVIGKPPCGIDPVTQISCHRFLRHFLPDDATLIVYGPDGDPYQYHGRKGSS